GSGPIKGFATTLMIGIATSLFTAIFISRLLIEAHISKKGGRLNFNTPMTKNLFTNLNFDFLGKRKIAYIVSSILLLIGLVSLFTNGLQQRVGFIAGRSYQIRFEQAVSPTELAADLAAEFGKGTNVKTFGNANQVKVTTPYKVDEEGVEVDLEIQTKLFNALQKYFPDGATFEDFEVGSTNRDIGIMEAVKVGPTIADDIKKNAVRS